YRVTNATWPFGPQSRVRSRIGSSLPPFVRSPCRGRIRGPRSCGGNRRRSRYISTSSSRSRSSRERAWCAPDEAWVWSRGPTRSLRSRRRLRRGGQAELHPEDAPLRLDAQVGLPPVDGVQPPADVLEADSGPLAARGVGIA